jgi:hypothetical protein
MEGALLVVDGAESATGGTGLLLSQGVGLALQEEVEGAFEESGSGGLGDLLQGVQIEFQGVVAGASGNDFAPSSGEFTEFLEFLGREGAACHAASCLGVETRRKEGVFPLPYDREVDAAKRFMTSPLARSRD